MCATILVLLAALCISFATGLSTHYLHLTAVISDSHDTRARFECWENATPFSSYPTVGESIIDLADAANVSYVVLPPRSEEGLHKPPHPMFFVLLSGLAHVTLPDGDEDLWIMEGVNGLIVAADIYGDGHYTEYPSDKPTVALQIPFKDGKMPAHRVVNDGICDPTEPSPMGSGLGESLNEAQLALL